MSLGKIQLKAKGPGLLRSHGSLPPRMFPRSVEIGSRESPYSPAWDYSRFSCRAISLCATQTLCLQEEGSFPFAMGGGGEDCRIRERERQARQAAFFTHHRQVNECIFQTLCTCNEFSNDLIEMGLLNQRILNTK